MDEFDLHVKKYEVTAAKVVADETKYGILVNGLSAVKDDRVKKLADHIVFNMEKLHDYPTTVAYLREVLCTQRPVGREKRQNCFLQYFAPRKCGK